MRIGINLLYMLPGIVGGTETYARDLLFALAKLKENVEYVLFMNRESSDWEIPKAPHFKRVVCPVNAQNQLLRYLYEQVSLPRLVKQHKICVLHSLGYVGPFWVPCRSVVSVHDILFDYPGSFIRKIMMYLLLNLVTRTCDKVITISENSKRQLQARFKLDAEKVVVTYLGPKNRERVKEQEKREILEILGLTDKFVLAFSSFSPSKNIPRLIEAFSEFSAKVDGVYRLVLVGHVPRDNSPITAVLKKEGLESQVIFTGYLPDQDVAALLESASIFAFPSLYEGFGMPVLEAMALGVPVAASTAASLPEVCGNAAVMFDPLSTSAMASALLKLAADPVYYETCRKNGYENVKRFNWMKTARETLDIYVSLAAEGVGRRGYG